MAQAVETTTTSSLYHVPKFFHYVPSFQTNENRRYALLFTLLPLSRRLNLGHKAASGIR